MIQLTNYCQLDLILHGNQEAADWLTLLVHLLVCGEQRVRRGEKERTPALTYGMMVAVMLGTQIQHMAHTSMMPGSHVYYIATQASIALCWSALVKILEFQSLSCSHFSHKLVLDCVSAVILWPDKASHLNPCSPGGQPGLGTQQNSAKMSLSWCEAYWLPARLSFLANEKTLYWVELNMRNSPSPLNLIGPNIRIKQTLIYTRIILIFHHRFQKFALNTLFDKFLLCNFSIAVNTESHPEK